jgi:hypothetical protein
MLSLIKKLFGAKESEPTPVPYKVETPKVEEAVAAPAVVDAPASKPAKAKKPAVKKATTRKPKAPKA